MIESHAIGATSAAVMPYYGKFLKAKMSHKSNLVQSHDAFRVWHVIGRGGRFAALSIAAQVCSDDREIPGKRRRDMVPHDMRLGMSMQEQERRSITPVPHAERCIAGINHG
jgi:hypothetical protein